MTAFNSYKKLVCGLRNSFASQAQLLDPAPGRQNDLGAQHAFTRKVILTSLLRSSSLRLHLQVDDTCFSFHVLVMSQHTANNTITAMTCQLTDIICALFLAEAAENIVCVRSKIQGEKVSYLLIVSEVKWLEF